MSNKTVWKIGITVLILWVICLLWCILELIFYGEITHRVVDDIVLLIFIPFVWNSVDVEVKENKNG